MLKLSITSYNQVLYKSLSSLIYVSMKRFGEDGSFGISSSDRAAAGKSSTFQSRIAEAWAQSDQNQSHPAQLDFLKKLV